MIGELLIGKVVDRAFEHLLLVSGKSEPRAAAREQEAERRAEFAGLSLLAGENERDPLAALRIRHCLHPREAARDKPRLLVRRYLFDDALQVIAAVLLEKNLHVEGHQLGALRARPVARALQPADRRQVEALAGVGAR